MSARDNNFDRTDLQEASTLSAHNSQLLRTSTRSRVEMQEAISVIINSTENEETKLVRYSQIKTWLAKNGLTSFVELATPPPELVEAVIQIRTEKRENRNIFRIKKRWINEILSWKNSKNYAELAAWLQLTSGRRIREIYASEYEVIDNMIQTDHLCKKRRKIDAAYKFPLYKTNRDEWIDRIMDLHDEIEEFEISLGGFVRRVNRTLEKVDSRLSSHKLRGMYAYLMWVESGRKRNQTGFIKDILCLESQGIAIDYSNYLYDSE